MLDLREPAPLNSTGAGMLADHYASVTGFKEFDSGIVLIEIFV